MISEGIAGIVMCPAKIKWDRGAFTRGSYGVWLDVDLTLPDSKPEINSAHTVLVPTEPDHIEFLVNQLNRFELSKCKVGDAVNLWDAAHTKEIFIYRQGSYYGEGKIGVCPDEFYKTISNAPGFDSKIAGIYEGGCKISCKLISKAEMADRLKSFKEREEKKLQRYQRDIATPAEYSAIDSDIYKCFISSKNGLCGGTAQQFREIEECIARLCQEKKGKYYKAQAKAAKFAIVLNPIARLYSNVTSLKEKGYKVITFEKALEHFGLTDLWDCKELIDAEKEYKKERKQYVKTLQRAHETTFGKPFPLKKGEDQNEEMVSAMAVQAKSVHKTADEIKGLIGKIEDWLDQKQETLNNEEWKNNPNLDKVFLYETQIETLETAITSLNKVANDLGDYE